MGDARVGDEALQVALREGDERPVDEADHREHGQCEGVAAEGVRHHLQGDADEPVGAHLQEHAGEDRRARTRRVDVRRRQPGVQRHQRRLDHEGDDEAEEDEAGAQPAARERRVLDDADHVEGVRRGRKVEADDPEEERQRSGQRVDEELDRRPGRVAVPPDGDDEVHADQAEVPEDEEEEEVERQEHAQRGRLEEEEEAVVGAFAPAQIERVGHRDGEEQRAERHQRQREAVDADLVADAERGDPRHRLDHGRQRTARVAQPDDDHEGERHQRETQCDAADDNGALARQEGHDQRAQERNGDHGGQHARASVVDDVGWRAAVTTRPPRRRRR